MTKCGGSDATMSVMHPDNWGWRARIGMFIVGVEAVPEAEWWAMLPSGVSVHASRISAPTPWASWTSDGSCLQLSDDLERGAKQFAAMPLSVVVVGHTSSSVKGGRGWDDAVVGQLSDRVARDTLVTTNGLDCRAALHAMKVRRPFLVFPAWFDSQVQAKGIEYFSDHGFQPSTYMRFDPGRNWRDLPPGELYRHGMGFAQDVEALYVQVRSGCPSEADSVLILGTGFRCVSILEALEQDLQRPVIAANQASLWHSLRLAGVNEQVAGYGSLLSL
ncbi:MAG: maleate cis-trans isomerase family protein [Hyphomicrobiaceae bacterium]